MMDRPVLFPVGGERSSLIQLRHFLARLLSVSALLLAAPIAALAEGRQVLFDVDYLVGVRDVTPPDFAAINPDERLVEARVQVSSLIRSGSDDDLLEFLYQMHSPERSLRVIDALPKTTLTTEIVGNFGVEKKQETVKQLKVTGSGQYEPFVEGTASGELSSKETSSVHYERMPPLELLAASGTVDRGYGAYFKLKPSPRTSLEGANQFLLILRVPAAWRADHLVVRCQAVAAQKSLVGALHDRSPCGGGRFLVALYLEGDDKAKAAAERLVRAEMRLRSVAERQRERGSSASFPTVVYKVGTLLDVVPPAVSDQWLDQLIYQPAGERPASLVTDRLPVALREAVMEFRSAKRQLAAWNGRPAGGL